MTRRDQIIHRWLTTPGTWRKMRRYALALLYGNSAARVRRDYLSQSPPPTLNGRRYTEIWIDDASN